MIFFDDGIDEKLLRSSLRNKKKKIESKFEYYKILILLINIKKLKIGFITTSPYVIEKKVLDTNLNLSIIDI